MLTVCVRAYLQEIAGSWGMIGGVQEVESFAVTQNEACIHVAQTWNKSVEN